VDKPHGAFYFFPDFAGLIPPGLAGRERAMYIYNKLMDRGVATVYGACFGKHFDTHIRFSFSMTPAEEIKEGICRMKEVFG
jgi:aspartate/methionine/tyrosine aminotransferase